MTLLPSKPKTPLEKERGLLTVELTEIRDISEILFKKLEKKIRHIEALDACVDRKIETLERLLQRSEALDVSGAGANRQHEIMGLQAKGLASAEIAEVLDMPRGEVELILELHTLNA